jgi:CRP/FNR family transcriptional regulator
MTKKSPLREINQTQMNDIALKLSFLGQEFISEIEETAILKEIPKGTEILRQEQYVKVLPIVLTGLVKVFSRFKERELLLYYIQPSESCIMTFSAAINQETSKVFAVTEEDTKLLLLPVEKLSGWLKTYPVLNTLFFQQFNLRYLELLDTIHHVLIDKMDKRLYDYLKEKARLTKKDTFKITHGQIANELGTVREVVSRVMKKLESEGKVEQIGTTIKITEW